MIARPPYDPALLAAATAMETEPRVTLEGLPSLRDGHRSIPFEQQFQGREVRWHDETVPGYRDDPILVTVIERSQRAAGSPGILYIHGGGMVMGTRQARAALFADAIERNDAVLVSVEYRLAPEFADPYPVEDCYAALMWMRDNAEALGLDVKRLLVAGGSAGGGLAAGVALLNRDRDGEQLLGQMLMCPMLDDRDSTQSTIQFEGVAGWDRRANRVGWTALLGDRKGGEYVSIYAAPGRAEDLSNLPATFIDCGSAEVFRDEDVAYAGRIWQCGGIADLHVWAGGYHGYESYAPEALVSRSTREARSSWLERVLTQRPG